MKTILRIIGIPIRLILLIFQFIILLILTILNYLDSAIGKINDYMVDKGI